MWYTPIDYFTNVRQFTPLPIQKEALHHIANNAVAHIYKERDVGGTRLLLEYAAYLTQLGASVVFVVPRYHEIKFITALIDQLALPRAIMVMAIDEVAVYCKGKHINAVIFDECLTDEIDKVLSYLLVNDISQIIGVNSKEMLPESFKMTRVK